MRRSPSSAPAPLVRAGGLVLANLLPLVGVLALGWNLWSLLVVYWVEALVTVVLAAVKALFAERGSPGVSHQVEPLHELREKRGGWRLRPSWPPVYPRNVPFALSILGAWVATVLPVSALLWLSVAPPVPLSADLALAVAALVVAQASDFATEYIGTEEYAEVSAQEIVRTPAQLTVLLMVFGLLATGGRPGGLAVLVCLVLVKTGAALYRFHVDHGGEPRVRVGEWLDVEEASEPPPEPTLPEGDVRARVPVSARSVLLGGVWSVAFGFASRVGIVALAVTVLGAVTGEPLWLAAGLAVCGVITAARLLSYYLRYGTIEYQRRGDALVAYDTALDAPQWVATVGPSTEFSVRNAVADRLLGTGTLVVSGVDSADGEVQVGPVADLDSVVRTLDLPVADTDRPDRDARVVLAALGLLACFVVVPAGLVLTPAVGEGTAVAVGLVLGPLLLLPVVALLWAALSRI